MLVEPVPTGPRSPARRALQLVGLALPVVLLAGVVTAGALGPRPEPLPGDDLASPDGVALASPPAAGTPEATASDTGRSAVVAFPPRLAGLAVRSVADTLAAHRQRPLAGIVAVAGHLTIRDLPAECADRYLGPFGTFCERRAVLADSPTRPYPSSTGGGSGFAAIGPHLHPTVPVGVRLPPDVVEALGGDGSPVAVVVLGRFTPMEPGPCIGGSRTCEAFSVERVAWVAGEAYLRTTTIDPALEVDWADEDWRARRSAARAALGFDRTPLLTAYVAPETLARIDPVAAQAVRDVAGGRPPGAAIWYVRGLEGSRDPTGGETGQVVWAVVDATGQTVIATSMEDASPDAAGPGRD